MHDYKRVEQIVCDPHVSLAELECSLKWACLYGCVRSVELLLKDGRVNPMLKNGWAIRVVAEDGNMHIMQLFLADGRVDPTIDESWTLRASAENGHENLLLLLLQDGRCDIHAGGDYAIHHAATEGHLGIIHILMDWGLIPTAETLECAAEGGHVHIVDFLLARTDFSGDDLLNAFWGAAECGHDDVVERLLVDTRLNPAAANNYAIRLAVENGHNIVVSLLMEDMRVFWTFAKPIERRVWYLLRVQKMRDLHNELIFYTSSKNDYRSNRYYFLI